jgi:hypothetical protein
MFKSRQYGARPAKRRGLVNSSISAEESRKFKTWRDSFAFSAGDERACAEGCDDPVQLAEQGRFRGATLGAEEQRALRYLGVALVVHWHTMPTTLQREIFDTAGYVGKSLETAALRGQIARFLHKHSEAGHGKLPLSKDAPGDARWGAAALSRWDSEGGAVRDELRM